MRTLLSVLIAIIFVVMIAACSGGTVSTVIPTSDPANATTEPTVTPNPENADEGTAEATADATADGTAEATAEGTADATEEATAESTAEGTAALETAFAIQINGGADGDVTISSDDGGEVTNAVAGVSADPEASSSGQQVLNTPASTLRTITFSTADDSVVFDLIFSDDLAPGEYQIGVNNVLSTVGNNINEDSSGQSTTGTGSEATAENMAEASPTAAGAASSTAQAGGNTAQGSTGSNTQGSSAGTSGTGSASSPSSSPQLGIVERDENFAPTIAARLEASDENLAGYNLVQGGRLMIESMSEASATGSFEFTMSPADEPTQTIMVSGAFTDIPLVQTAQSNAATSP
ncbi:MAG: hypothetical protein K8I30_23625 [Anaerolineae bacterium]|nr:hypothetical protein [Anaerolineae bacterium]